MVRPIDVLVQNVFLQPELGVLPDVTGVVMASWLVGKRPSDVWLETLEELLALFVNTVVAVGAVEPETRRTDVRCVCLRSDTDR